MKYTFPTAEYGKDAVLMQIDTALLPIVAGKLTELTQQHIWIDQNSWRSGYNAIAEMLLMQNGIVEAIDRLYMLTDAIYNGTAYSADGSTPPVVTPAIPAAPGAVDVSSGLRKQLLDMQGTNPTSWPFGFGARATTLADVAAALKQQTPAAVDSTKELMATLSEIGVVEGGISAAAGVVSTLGSWLTAAETEAGEGLMLTTMAAGIAANAALMGLQAKQLDTLISKLDRLVTSLDGGVAPPPTTNVIAELQATNNLLG